jgi:hypothetical protein
MQRPRHTRHDKSVAEAVEKKIVPIAIGSVSAKMAVRQSDSPIFYFSIELLWLTAMRVFFSIAVAELLAWLVFRGLNNLCAAHRFSLCQALLASRAWALCDGSAVGCPEASGLFFQWVVLVQTFLQVLQVDLSVTLCASQV